MDEMKMIQSGNTVKMHPRIMIMLKNTFVRLEIRFLASDAVKECFSFFFAATVIFLFLPFDQNSAISGWCFLITALVVRIRTKPTTDWNSAAAPA